MTKKTIHFSTYGAWSVSLQRNSDETYVVSCSHRDATTVKDTCYAVHAPMAWRHVSALVRQCIYEEGR